VDLSLPDPSLVLSDGAAILGALLLPLGFEFRREEAGKGSGGFYAVGKFRRAGRVVELHFRYSPGLVSYRAASISLSHEDYMPADTDLMRQRPLEALKMAIGAWKDADHPELRCGADAYIRNLRLEGERRTVGNYRP